MHNVFLKIGIGILCIICSIILLLKPNVMDEIGKQKVYGTNDVPEINKCYDTWEWMNGLETMGAFDVKYKEKYLSENVSFIHLCFYCDNNDVSIGIMVNLSESDKVMMKLDMRYYCEEKRLTYDSVYILQGEEGTIYSDEKSIDEFFSKYGLTRQDVKEYQEYAIYDVVVKTWSKAHMELYWLERWRLKRCEVVDNTFQFEDI